MAVAQTAAAAGVASKLQAVSAQLEELHALREGVLGDLVSRGGQEGRG